MTPSQALSRLLSIPTHLIESSIGYTSVSSLIGRHMIRDRYESTTTFPRTEPAGVEIQLGEDLHQAIDLQIKNEIGHWNHDQLEKKALNRRLDKAEYDNYYSYGRAYYSSGSLGRSHSLYKKARRQAIADAYSQVRAFVPVVPSDPRTVVALKSIEYAQYMKFREDFRRDYPTFYPVASELTVCSHRHALIGRVDALFADDHGRVIIIDWKRSRSPGCESMVGETPATGILASFPNNVCGRRMAQLNLYREILSENLVVVVDLIVVVFHPDLGEGVYAMTKFPFQPVLGGHANSQDLG